MQKHMNVKPVAEDPAAPLTVTNIDPDNGQAHNLIYPGLSIRATIAMHALPAVIRQCSADPLELVGEYKSREHYFADRAVACADALIAELQK